MITESEASRARSHKNQSIRNHEGSSCSMLRVNKKNFCSGGIYPQVFDEVPINQTRKNEWPWVKGGKSLILGK